MPKAWGLAALNAASVFYTSLHRPRHPYNTNRKTQAFYNLATSHIFASLVMFIVYNWVDLFVLRCLFYDEVLTLNWNMSAHNLFEIYSKYLILFWEFEFLYSVLVEVSVSMHVLVELSLLYLMCTDAYSAKPFFFFLIYIYIYLYNHLFKGTVVTKMYVTFFLFVPECYKQI